MLATPEVSFNLRGERGSIDVLAFHAASRALLVVEVKSVVPDLQAMLYGIDRTARVAPDVARERGWDPAGVSRLLVLPNDKTARRRIVTHRATFQTALPAAGQAVRPWLREPSGPISGLLFVSDAPHRGNRP